MAQTDALKKYLDAGMAFTQLTRSKAEQVVKELVAAGELQRQEAKSVIDDLVERSRRNAEALADQVRQEVESQLANIGLARKGDVERLEAELARLRGAEGESEGADEPEAQSHGAPAEEAPAKEAPTGDAPAETAANGAPVPTSGELPAKKAAKQAPAKKAPAKKAAKPKQG